VTYSPSETRVADADGKMIVEESSLEKNRVSRELPRQSVGPLTIRGLADKLRRPGFVYSGQGASKITPETGLCVFRG
jgi:hypothetical protein